MYSLWIFVKMRVMRIVSERERGDRTGNVWMWGVKEWKAGGGM